MSPIRVAHTGTPRTKLWVPSIGSTTQRRGPHPEVPSSSPSTASRGRARPSVPRISSSHLRSASVTRVVSGLVDTCRSAALYLSMVSESASSASTCASRRSSVCVLAMASRLSAGASTPGQVVLRQFGELAGSVLPDTVNGLPLHALSVHATVVLVPLLALLGVMYAVPRLRGWTRWPLGLLAIGAAGSTWVSMQSGHNLDDALAANNALAGAVGDAVARHIDLANQLQWMVYAYAVIALIAVFLVQPGTARDSDQGSDRTSRRRPRSSSRQRSGRGRRIGRAGAGRRGGRCPGRSRGRRRRQGRVEPRRKRRLLRRLSFAD